LLADRYAQLTSGADRMRDLKAATARADIPMTAEPDQCEIKRQLCCQPALKEEDCSGTDKIMDMGEASSKMRHAEVTETTS
jgi:hypothetical protein